ncbi:unnamed protein product [Allacma fusca]|uniref:Uncharacterized protein n=1 Tax=Allacma fusca TaxID=39272 RepID=A0A8J2JRJ0_9HEXA|nr:unnamed protein product [Allacma fusca]
MPFRSVENVSGYPELSGKRDALRSFANGDSLQDNIRSNYKTTMHNWCWWDSFTGKLIQAQSFAFCIVIICQGFILTKFGSPVFCLLVGTGIWIPFIFVVALLHGLCTHALPTYWRIAISIITHAGTSQVTFLLVIKDIINICRIQPLSAYILDAWVAWIIIVAATLSVSVISFILFIISLRDILRILRTKTLTGDSFLIGEKFTV